MNFKPQLTLFYRKIEDEQNEEKEFWLRILIPVDNAKYEAGSYLFEQEVGETLAGTPAYKVNLLSTVNLNHDYPLEKALKFSVPLGVLSFDGPVKLVEVKFFDANGIDLKGKSVVHIEDAEEEDEKPGAEMKAAS